MNNEMGAETLKALQGSNRKWEKISFEGGIDVGSINCPLCVLFLAANCATCPVAVEAQIHGCKGTPYGAWARNFIGLPEKKVRTNSERALAIDELIFLSMLLPEGVSA